jgi:hypothetical protein
LRSLPRPESGRGPATVSSQSWSRRPITTGTVRDWLNGWLPPLRAWLDVCARRLL